jgi:hypothetical protein
MQKPLPLNKTRAFRNASPHHRNQIGKKTMKDTNNSTLQMLAKIQNQNAQSAFEPMQ